MLRAMASSQRIDRKLFLTWALSSGSAVALGCSDDATETPGNTAGTGGSAAGSGGSGGSAGTFTTGGTTAGSGGTSTTAGSGGTTAGSGGTTAGGGGAGGTGGSGGSGGAAPMPNCSTQLKVTITSNHGHVMMVSMDDVMAGVDKAYATKGASMHEHWVQLTAADFTKLKAGGTVRKLTCNDEHEHEYIINCLGNEKPDTSSGLADKCAANKTCADEMGNYCPALPDLP